MALVLYWCVGDCTVTTMVLLKLPQATNGPVSLGPMQTYSLRACVCVSPESKPDLPGSDVQSSSLVQLKGQCVYI